MIDKSIFSMPSFIGKQY